MQPSLKTGKPYHIRKQQAYAHLEGQKYPVAFTLNVPNDRQPYLPGFYSIDESTFYVYPEAEMDNIRFIEIIYGLVFSDGLCTKEKGLKQLRVRTSTKGYDTDPDVDRWTMMLELRFRQIITKTIGRSFAEVEVDGEGD